MEYNIFRLKNIRPISWQLPIKDMNVEKFIEENGQKKSLGYRRIVYIPGTNSIFREDIKGDLQPESLWFEYGEKRVPVADTLLNELLFRHPLFNVKYELWSENAEDIANLEKLRFRAQVTQMIDDSSADHIKAVAMAVFGSEAAPWTEEKSELRLREKANEDPKQLKEIIDASDYQAKLIASQAFVYNLVKENSSQTAVVWNDNDGIILKLAKGEHGINELGRFLSVKTEDSEKVLQSIGERLGKIITATEGKDTATVLSEKDKEIAELKKLLAAKNDLSDVDPELREAREAYVAATGKDVPNNKKNDIKWLLEKAK